MNLATKTNSHHIGLTKNCFPRTQRLGIFVIPDGKWFLFRLQHPRSARRRNRLDFDRWKRQAQSNPTQSGFDDGCAKWVMGGKAMLWFSNREDSKACRKVAIRSKMSMHCFSRKPPTTNLNSPKKKPPSPKNSTRKLPKPDTTKKKEIKKDTTVVIDRDGLELRKARLTIHFLPTSLMHLSTKKRRRDMLYYLTRFEKGYNL
ncbi:MAG: hypothetical protein R2822_29490 [Spirosomataceae bacterium]